MSNVRALTKDSYMMHSVEGLVLVWQGFLLAKHTHQFHVSAEKSKAESIGKAFYKYTPV